MAAKTSVWRPLRYGNFRSLWLASVLSGCCVSGQDLAATWLLNDLQAPAFFLSALSTCAALPFLVCTLPAGVIADLMDRRKLLRLLTVWLALNAAWLGVVTLLGQVRPFLILLNVFCLGIGFSMSAPAWSALTPELVPKDELAAALTLNGVQMNVCGILGPVLGSALLTGVGPASLFVLNAAVFLVLTVALRGTPPRTREVASDLESVSDAFVGAIRYLQHAPGIQAILSRNFVFSLLISAVPSLVPVLGLKVLRMDAAHLGFLFTSMAIGSLVGAVYLLPWLRRRGNPNGATLWAGGLLAGVFLLMAWVRQPVAFVGVTALAGVAWTVSASELWVAAQQATPAWARGRLNAAFMMTGQGAMALGGLLWGVAVTGLGAQATLLLAALAAGVGWALAARLSINFASRLRLEADPYSEDLHEAMHRRPSPQEGPVTVSVEYRIPVGSRERFLALMEEIRKGLLRNGALSFRLNENLERPEVYRLDLLASSWADHERQHRRMTQDEKARWQEAWALHGGPGSPQTTHSVATKPGAWAKPTDQPARPSTLAFASRIPPAIE